MTPEEERDEARLVARKLLEALARERDPGKAITPEERALMEWLRGFDWLKRPQ